MQDGYFAFTAGQVIGSTPLLARRDLLHVARPSTGWTCDPATDQL
jgi:hypothetical protein